MRLSSIPENKVLEDLSLTQSSPTPKRTLLNKTWQWIQKHEKAITAITFIAASILTSIFTSGLFLPTVFGFLGGSATYSFIKENLLNTCEQDTEDSSSA